MSEREGQPIETMGEHMLAACEDSRTHMGAFFPMGAPFVVHHAASEQSNHGMLLDEDLFHGSLGGMSMGGIFPSDNSRDATAVSNSLGPCMMDSRDCHSFPGLIETEKASRASPDGETGEKKPSGTWTAEENRIFFDALRTHGRSFDRILDEMGATKTREQVRCYYYRVIKKINQIIESTGAKIDKGTGAEGSGVIEAMLCWWGWMHTGNVEDTSISLFKKSASIALDERQAADFAQTLFAKSAAKPHSLEDPTLTAMQISTATAPVLVPATPMVAAEVAVVAVKMEPGVAAVQAERAGGGHAVAKIDFEAAANPPKAQQGAGVTPLKAFPVNAKLEPCPIVPLARRDAVAAGVAPPLQVETTPGRRDGQRDGQETVLVGETPHREERLSLAMQLWK
ncbi:hypothetical protein T484DRAFT_1770592 [Baffinella frigidus]|nr:hypothetical protein T484DRAFT_1770592 [Cryptophyta sp. CCMP2293]